MRLVRGGPGAGKTALVLREFKEAVAAGEPACIVAPTATLVRHLQHELARDGVVFRPSSVVSLSRLMGTESDPLALRVAVREQLATGSYPEFASVSETGGLIDSVLETLDLFANAGATPDKVAAVRRIGRHGQAFLRLWKAVEPKMPRRAPVLPTGKVWMDGFLGFSPVEKELVAAIAKTCELTLTLPDSDAFNDVRRMAIALGAKDEPVYGPVRRPVRTVVEAPTVEREADEIARRILRLREQGTPFREIGVALRDSATYLPLLRGTFERCGIPARYYFSDALRHHPAAVFLNGVVENTLDGWEFGAALAVLRAHPGWGRHAWFDRFDFAVREAMPGRGAEALLGLCDAEHQTRLAEVLSAAHWARETVRVRDWVFRLGHMARTLYRPGFLEVASDARAVAAERSYAAGLRAWLEAIERAGGCWADGEERISLARFWQVAKEAVATASVRVRDDRGDVVHVMDVFEARQWDVSALFVCGMTNRDFPRRPSPNPLFTDAELERIAKSGVPVRIAADVEKQEQALMAALEGRASAAMVLSVPSRDASGRAVERSVFAAAPVAARRSILIPRVSASPPAQAGRIARTELLKVDGLTATSLEDMAQCRFKFFARRSLGIRPRPERPRERLSPGTLGNIIHAAMEKWVAGGREGGLAEVFDREFEKVAAEKRFPAGYELEVKRLRWRGFAAKLSGKDRWPVESSETEVSLTATLPGDIPVTCRIDRLDVLPDGQCVVIDYKSGSVANIKGNTQNETKLQGPLYALAARQERGLETLAMMYIAIQTEQFFGWGEVPGSGVSLEPMPERWIESAAERATERLRIYLAGDVKAAPTERGPCRWCDYKNACRADQAEALVMVEGAHGA